MNIAGVPFGSCNGSKRIVFAVYAFEGEVTRLPTKGAYIAELGASGNPS